MMAERLFGQDFWENGAQTSISSSIRHQAQLHVSVLFYCESGFKPLQNQAELMDILAHFTSKLFLMRAGSWVGFPDVAMYAR